MNNAKAGMPAVTSAIPVEVEVSGGKTGPKYAGLGVKANSAPTRSFGPVVNANVNTPTSDFFPDVLSMTYDNSAGGAAVTLIVFDAIGAVAAAEGGAPVSPTWSGTSNTVLQKAIQAQPLQIKSFNYRITTGTDAQFSQAFKFAQASMDGTYATKPLQLGNYLRNNAQNSKILTIDQLMTFGIYNALIITVAAGVAIAIDFTTNKVFNTMNG